jgi:hypothetical protein
MKHEHWCAIKGHWFECNQAHEPDYIGTKKDSEDGYPVELRDDCPQCAGFHWWKIPRWLRYFWNYWVCSRMVSPYWKWRVRRQHCKGCGKCFGSPHGTDDDERMVLLYSIFHMTDGYVCRQCQHFPKPECGPHCDFCMGVDEEDLR